jgi:hypothetical protein
MCVTLALCHIKPMKESSFCSALFKGMKQGFNHVTVVCPGILLGKVGSTNSIEDRGQRDWVSGEGSPLVRGSAQFANE